MTFRPRHLLAALAVSVVGLGLAVSNTQAAPGDLDTSFGASGGYTVSDGGTSVAQTAHLWSELTLADGSTISSYFNVLARRHPDGTPDAGYGNNGFVFMPPRERRPGWANELEVQGDSTILAANGSEGSEGTVYLERRNNETGALDLSFGDEGLVKLTTARFLSEFDGPMWMNGASVDASGRIYLLLRQNDALHDGTLLRLDPDGKVDETFGAGGILQYDAGSCDFAQDLTVKPDGIYMLNYRCVDRLGLDGSQDPSFQQAPLNERQYLTGFLEVPGSNLLLEGLVNENGGGLTVWKLHADGSLDETFGTNGKLDTFDPGVQYWGVDVDSEGQIFASGHTNFRPGHSVVARFTPEGDRDLTFGPSGKVQIADDPALFNGTFFRVKDTPAGLLVYGDLEFFSGSRVYSMRLRDDNTFDPDWGEGGRYWFTTDTPTSDLIADTVTTADGKTLATGGSGDQAVVLRYLKNGRIDRSFADQGWLRLENPTDLGESGAKIALMRNGDAVVCIRGQAESSVVRIRSNGEVVTAFAESGRFRHSDLFGSQGRLIRCEGISSAPGGKILVGGTLYNGQPVVFRLKSNGKMDPAFGRDGITRIGTEANPQYDDPVAFTSLADGRSLIATRSKLVRLKPNGNRDGKFARRGTFDLAPGKKPIVHTPRTIAVSPKGAIFLGGTDQENLVLVKFNRNGELARKFGKRGVLGITHPKFTTQVNDIKFRPDGRVLMAVTGAEECWAFRECLETMLIYQLADRGKRDRSFGRNGLVTRRIGANSRAASLELTRRGIVIGGFAETGNTLQDLLLLRLRR